MRLSRASFVILTMLILCLMLWMNIVHAQEGRDYAITRTEYEFSADESTFAIVVGVVNQGETATATAEVAVYAGTNDGRLLFRDNLSPLNAGQTVFLRLTPFITADFAGGTQIFTVEVGVDDVEPRGAAIASDNSAPISVDIPRPATDETITDNRVIASSDALITWTDDSVIVYGREFSQTRIVIYGAITVAIALGIWLLTLLFRMLFKRKPTLPTFQPPYATVPMLDQNTTEGRRQAWQQHAQNNLLLAAPSEGNIHAVKLLLSNDNTNLSNWSVTGMRLSQYDSYGRIARSQAVAEKRYIKRMNRVLRKRHKVNDDRIQRMLRPIAKHLVQTLKKNVTKKSAFLPVSMDVRFEGKHGEVRIMFELYQCRSQAWYRIDHWEPQMLVVTNKMQENLTFTIHGKSANEKWRGFFNRLQDDVIWLLMEAIRLPQPEDESTATGVPQEPFDVPDTLASQPIVNDVNEDDEFAPTV